MNYPTRTIFHFPVTVQTSRIVGRGLFTGADIKAGDNVMRWGGIAVPRSVVLAGDARLNSVVELDSGDYLVDLNGEAAQPDEFLNHSCDPNLWMFSDVDLVARRDIPAGTELLIDYGLYRSIDWVVNPKHVMPCRCGSRHCRLIIRADDHLTNATMRHRYAGYFAPYLEREIEAHTEPVESTA